MKPDSPRSKKPKLYEMGVGAPGSSTTIALWPKRSKNTSPGCMVSTPMRGEAAIAAVENSHTNIRSKAVWKVRTWMCGLLRRDPRSSIRMHAHMQSVQAARVGARDTEAEAAEREFLARFRQVADGGGEQATDRVVLVIVEIGPETFVEIGDRRERIDDEMPVGLRRDQLRLVHGLVVLVVDVADDLFQHVLDRDQAGDATIFVDHDRHVVARLAELAQQHVEFLRFGDQHGRAQEFAHAVAGMVVVGDD